MAERAAARFQRLVDLRIPLPPKTETKRLKRINELIGDDGADNLSGIEVGAEAVAMASVDIDDLSSIHEPPPHI